MSKSEFKKKDDDIDEVSPVPKENINEFGRE